MGLPIRELHTLVYLLLVVLVYVYVLLRISYCAIMFSLCACYSIYSG